MTAIAFFIGFGGICFFSWMIDAPNYASVGPIKQFCNMIYTTCEDVLSLCFKGKLNDS